MRYSDDKHNGYRVHILRNDELCLHNELNSLYEVDSIHRVAHFLPPVGKLCAHRDTNSRFKRCSHTIQV